MEMQVVMNVVTSTGAAMSVPGRRRGKRRAAAAQGRDRCHFARAIWPWRSAEIVSEFGRATVTVDDAESPLAWLARRRGRDGRALIEAHQLQAGERLRADFTRAHLMPRTTANWSSPISSGRRGGEGAASATDTMVAARQRVHPRSTRVGPEFAGLLLDICCFLKGLADIERERAWPARSGKVVLQLALDRLARHYGYAAQTAAQGAHMCGHGWPRMRSSGWSVCDDPANSTTSIPGRAESANPESRMHDVSMLSGSPGSLAGRSRPGMTTRT